MNEERREGTNRVRLLVYDKRSEKTKREIRKLYVGMCNLDKKMFLNILVNGDHSTLGTRGRTSVHGL